MLGLASQSPARPQHRVAIISRVQGGSQEARVVVAHLCSSFQKTTPLEAMGVGKEVKDCRGVLMPGSKVVVSTPKEVPGTDFLTKTPRRIEAGCTSSVPKEAADPPS